LKLNFSFIFRGHHSLEVQSGDNRLGVRTSHHQDHLRQGPEGHGLQKRPHHLGQKDEGVFLSFCLCVCLLLSVSFFFFMFAFLLLYYFFYLSFFCLNVCLFLSVFLLSLFLSFLFVRFCFCLFIFCLFVYLLVDNFVCIETYLCVCFYHTVSFIFLYFCLNVCSFLSVRVYVYYLFLFIFMDVYFC